MSDRFNVQGWLLLPENVRGKLPLVTLVHGGPASAAQPYFSGPGLAESLLERGYALLRPNPRGSYGQGERFTLANYRDFGHGDMGTSSLASMRRKRQRRSTMHDLASPAAATAAS